MCARFGKFFPGVKSKGPFLWGGGGEGWIGRPEGGSRGGDRNILSEI